VFFALFVTLSAIIMSLAAFCRVRTINGSVFYRLWQMLFDRFSRDYAALLMRSQKRNIIIQSRTRTRIRTGIHKSEKTPFCC